MIAIWGGAAAVERIICVFVRQNLPIDLPFDRLRMEVAVEAFSFE